MILQKRQEESKFVTVSPLWKRLCSPEKASPGRAVVHNRSVPLRPWVAARFGCSVWETTPAYGLMRERWSGRVGPGGARRPTACQAGKENLISASRVMNMMTDEPSAQPGGEQNGC